MLFHSRRRLCDDLVLAARQPELRARLDARDRIRLRVRDVPRPRIVCLSAYPLSKKLSRSARPRRDRWLTACVCSWRATISDTEHEVFGVLERDLGGRALEVCGGGAIYVKNGVRDARVEV